MMIRSSKTKKQLVTANMGGMKDGNMGKGDFCPRKQDPCLFNMGGLRASECVITQAFSLHVGRSRHFTRLRHTLKRVILCCFSLLFIVIIGRLFCRISHYLGPFFYPGQFKTCFPHIEETIAA